MSSLQPYEGGAVNILILRRRKQIKIGEQLAQGHEGAY